MADMHTPLPWKLHRRNWKMKITGNIHQITDADGHYPTAFVPAWDAPIAGEEDGSAEALANAELIVTAVNERPALLKTIKALEEKLKAIRNKIPMSYLQRHDVAGATGPTSECDIVAAMADFSAARWEMIGRLRAADEQIKALREQIATKDAALRDADYALSNLIEGFEFDDDSPDEPCQFHELCGNRMCEDCGCLKDKRDAARAALAGSAS